MSNLFHPDNFLWRCFGKIADFFGLSCMWLFCSLPIITIGTASIALYDTVAHCIREDESYLAKRFFRTFKRELLPGILITILWAVIAMVFWFGLQIVYQISQEDPSTAIFAVVYNISLLIPVGILGWVFAVQSRFVYKFFQLHKMALYFTFAHLPATVGIVALSIVTLVLIMIMPGLVIILPAFMVYCQSWFIERVFVKYMPKQETEAVSEELTEN